jgi:hypothetical protein
MDIRADEISRIIKDKIGNLSNEQDLTEVGVTSHITDPSFE